MFNQPTIESEWKVKIDTVSTRFLCTSQQVAQEASKSDNRLPCKQCCQQLGKIGRIRRSRKKTVNEFHPHADHGIRAIIFLPHLIHSTCLGLSACLIGDKHVSLAGDVFSSILILAFFQARYNSIFNENSFWNSFFPLITDSPFP